MNSQDRLIDAKISILQLAEKLESISEACKVAQIARSSFYEIKKAYEQFGREGLVPRPKRRPRMPNEYPQEIVDKILEMTRIFPSYSYVRVAGQLQLEGVSVSPGGVRKTWERHGLLRKLSRCLWLEREVSEGRGIMTERALKAVARLKRLEQASDQHVGANAPGELLSQDLYFVGVIKGVCKINLQSAVDCSCSVGFARLCVSKQPIHSVALIHERVLPFYDALAIDLKAILTDCGREYCGRPDNHYFELYLGSFGIEHRPTPMGLPNGSIGRSRTSSLQKSFEKRSIRAWSSCRWTWISFWSSTTTAVYTAGTGAKEGPQCRPSRIYWYNRRVSQPKFRPHNQVGQSGDLSKQLVLSTPWY